MRGTQIAIGAARRFPPLARAGGTLLIAGIVGTGATAARAAVTATPDYIVGSIPLPGTSSADLAFAGTSILVGQGSFGAGLQSITRVERDGTATTLVTGLNALGGLAWDRAGDRLLFTDNAGELIGAATGDTVFTLAGPLSAAASVPALGLELRPAGTIGNAQAVLPLTGGDVLVGDAAGFGAGRIVQLSGVSTTNLITGLDYTAGVSLTTGPSGELLIGSVDSGTFVGSIGRYTPAGAPIGSLIGGLSGAIDQTLDRDGNLLVTGGFDGGFTTSTVIRVTPAGASTEIAQGFGFSSGIDIDTPSGQIGVLDFGAGSIDTLTPVSALTPGGSARSDCQVEAWGGRFDTSSTGRPRARWTCVDGEECDRDAAAGSCTFLVGACFTVTDSRLPSCTAAGVDAVLVSASGSPTWLPALQATLSAVVPTTASARCSAGVPITVAAGKTARLAIRGITAGKTVDRDSLALRCRNP